MVCQLALRTFHTVKHGEIIRNFWKELYLNYCMSFSLPKEQISIFSMFKNLFYTEYTYVFASFFTSVGCQNCVCWLSVSHRDPQGWLWPRCAKWPPAWMLLMSKVCQLAHIRQGREPCLPCPAWGPIGTPWSPETWSAHPNWHTLVSSNTKYPVPIGTSLSSTTWKTIRSNRVNSWHWTWMLKLIN